MDLKNWKTCFKSFIRKNPKDINIVAINELEC